MATLADSFLQDLEDLEEDMDSGEPTRLDDEDDDEDIIDAVEAYERSLKSTAAVVSDLTSKPEFKKTLERVKELTEIAPKAQGEVPQDDEEYQLITKCNTLVGTVDSEIMNVHKFIRDIYSKKLPELESIVYAPLDYISIVKRVQNETDLTKIDLSDLLPNTVIMAVTVAASMTTGSTLPPSELDKVLKASDEALHLADCRRDILLYLESRMSMLAPNLSAILGSSLAARLVTHAGGLLNLSRMPAQNIMLVGSQKKSAMGMSSASAGPAMGIICQGDIIQSTPPAFRNRAIKLVAGKCSLAARVDAFHESTNGAVGIALREKILSSLSKAQEPPPAPLKKALPIPETMSKPKRGGKRHRKMKEKYGMSEYAKQADRLKFGPEAEEEYGLAGERGGFGMLGKSTGFGKLKLQVKQQKMGVPKRMQQRIAPSSSAASGAVGGFQSSLAFTPVQGIELANPEANRLKQGGHDKYFSSTGTFSKVQKDRASMIPKAV